MNEAPLSLLLFASCLLLLAEPASAHDDPCVRHAVTCHSGGAPASHEGCHHGGRCLRDSTCCHGADCKQKGCGHASHLSPLERARLRAELDQLRARSAQEKAQWANHQVELIRRAAWRARDRANYTGSRADWDRVDRLEQRIPLAREEAARVAAQAGALQEQAAESRLEATALERTLRARPQERPRCGCL